MGLLDRMKGVKRPEQGTPVLASEEVFRRLAAMAGDQVPFTVQPSDEADLEVEWRIVDAQWYEIFAEAGLQKSHKILLGLNGSEHEVRALEQSWEVSWRAGVPELRMSKEKFQGRTMGSKSFGQAVAFTGADPLDWGQVYKYRFDVSEMKDPIIAIATRAGWSYVPVTTKDGLRDS